MKKISIKGYIIPNDYKWYYDWMNMDTTCPNDVKKELESAAGESVEIYINSPGGDVPSGSEIYTDIANYTGDVKIYITGEACSAASYIATAAYCEMSPVALFMIHCCSTSVTGNHKVLEHASEMARTIDLAIANAYVKKSGMSMEEALGLMEHETYMTASQALEHGLIDGIMFDGEGERFVASHNFSLPTNEQMDQVSQLMKKQQSIQGVAFIIAKSKLNLLKLKGVETDV